MPVVEGETKRCANIKLRNVDGQSMAIIDELGRGTSTRDGLAIALAISEALLESNCMVWFATHFVDLGTFTPTFLPSDGPGAD
jgi:DNA mismatch repair ATPase MutS